MAVQWNLCTYSMINLLVDFGSATNHQLKCESLILKICPPYNIECD